MNLHLAGRHLRTGATVLVHAAEPVVAASVIKLPVMVHVLRAVEAGTLSHATVAPLVRPMIAVSSNESTNDLLDVVGLDAVQATIGTLDMPSTVLRRRMLDMPARAAGRENVTTATDVLTLLEHLIEGSLLSAAMTDFAMECLLAQELPGLPVPAGLRFAHKTGELVGVRHDAGILLDGDGPVAVVVALVSGLELADDDVTPPDLFDPAAASLFGPLGLVAD